jgi:hypothetical protein
MYEPNSFTAVLSRLETNVGSCVDALEALRSDYKEGQRRLHERLDSHEEDIGRLKEADTIRKREVKWAVAIIAVVGWAANAAIAWIRGT